VSGEAWRDASWKDSGSPTSHRLECVEIQHEEGTGVRPAALVSFQHKSFDSLGKLALRLNGLYWKERKLSCSTTIAPG